ncbi:FHA domain-containing protein [Aromatoleum sp.]|uniref:FHA domain-containing protein n=1 Tax=Aromatoleum sp. TaxID=2307007 RepID=UPI002FC5AA03
MSAPAETCALVADVSGRDILVDALGVDEAKHAIDRCLHRVERAVAANGGSVIRRGDGRLSATFPRCDPAVLASVDMLARVEDLPPQRGLRLTIRVGIHYGRDAAAGPVDAAATRIATAARPGQLLASGPAVLQLSAAARRFAGASAIREQAFDGIEWPVFPLQREPAALAPAPDVARAPLRLRLRHLHEVLYVEESRPVVLLGRELGNDVVIVDARASRHHARIERRPQGFVLIDRSTNGTYVADAGGGEHCVKRAEWPLGGAGRLGCGFPANEIERDLVFFELL